MLSTRKIIFYEFDNFRLDVEQQKLLKDGKPVTLTNKAFQTLLILVQKSGQIVEREEIISEIWTDSFVEDSNLSQYVYVLRKIFGNNPQGTPYIETITKRGFRFTGAAKELPGEEDSTAEVLSADSIEFDSLHTNEKETENKNDDFSAVKETETNDKPQKLTAEENETADSVAQQISTPKINRNRRVIFALAAVLLFGVVFAAVYFYSNRQVSTPTPDSAAIKSIAVLPFQPIGKETDNQKLGLGMADAVIMRLSKLKRIPVRSTGAVFGFTDQPAANSAKAGLELGVDTVLEGTVQREGERIRVSVQLVNVADGKPLWAESYNETFTDIFAVQDSISAKVAQSLAINLTREQEQILAERATKSPQAFELYQLGVYHLNKRSKNNLQKAVETFQQAINLDPNYAQAYAGLADSYDMLGYYNFADRNEMNAKAREAAQKALSLDENLAEAQMALADVLANEGNQNLALPAIERAVEISPFNSTVRVRYAWILLGNNNLDEAVKQARLAQEYDPLSHLSNNVTCGFLSFQRRLDEAVPFCEKAVAIEPNAPRNRLVTAKVYFFSGRHDDAFKQLQILLDSPGNTSNNEALGLQSYFLAKLGRRAEAEAIFSVLKTKAPQDANLYGYLTLTAYALGNYEESLNFFKKAKESNQTIADVLRFRYDPLWEEIKNDKRFVL